MPLVSMNARELCCFIERAEYHTLLVVCRGEVNQAQTTCNLHLTGAMLGASFLYLNVR